MSIFAEPTTGRAHPPRIRRAVLFAALAAATLSAAVFAAPARDNEGGLVKTAMQPKAAARSKTGGYELRCWQYGRLILEEHFLQPPPESASDALRMNDEAGKPVRVLETSNATCLLKAVSVPPKAIRP